MPRRRVELPVSPYPTIAVDGTSQKAIAGGSVVNRNLLATAICASLVVAGTAYAQGASAPQQSQNQTTTQQSSSSSQPDQKKNEPGTKEKPQVLKTITVTGSLLKGISFQGQVPVQVVPIQERMAAGMNTIASFIQTSAAAGGATQINGQYGGFILEGGTGIKPVNLRGLGASRTLVLLDGQRPGPAGTGNQVNNFDLNVIPRALIQRIEIVNDGSSSIYGSDAIAGVINLITKQNIDHPSFDIFSSVPSHGGGQEYSGSFATGWNFKNGNITLAAELDQQQPLRVGQRSFLDCSRPLVFGPDGKRVDLPDTSINAGTPLEGCNNSFFDVAIDLMPSSDEEANYPHFAEFVPNPAGVTGPLSPVKGYFLATCYNYNNPDTGLPEANPGCNQVTDLPQWGRAYAIAQTRNTSFWLAPSFTLNTPIGPVQWNTQLLINRRVTHDFYWRQFFPAVAEQNGQSYAETLTTTGVYNGHIYLPVMIFPNYNEVWDNYKYLRTQLSGGFGNSSWTWTFNVHATQSDGTNYLLGISCDKSGDNFEFPCSNAPLSGQTPVNYFDPEIIDGTKMNELVAALGDPVSESTIYKQQDANLLFQGNIPLDLPAGPIGAAFGTEMRHFSIFDDPLPQTWGYSHSGITQAGDTVKGFYGELGIPLIENVPLINHLSVTLSGREFRYNVIAKWSHVWKYGLNWQVTPTVRLRGTLGTSYRAPALFQQFQAATSGFVAQRGTDPCIDWALSTSANVQAHCAAAGIPNDYNGGGASATVFTIGGGSALQSETSRAKSAGIVWSPTFANLDFSVDYFDYHVFNEVTQIGAAAIVNGCYALPVYPNEFCNFFTRNPPVPGQPNAEGANNITSINNPWINLNQERDRGYQFTWNYVKDFAFGQLTVNGSAAYLTQHTQQVFSTSATSGFSTNDFTGTIGNPRWYGIFNAALKRNDWTVNWEGIFVSRTSQDRIQDPVQSYAGLPNSTIIIHMGAQLRQTLSGTWNNGTFGVTFGVRNLTDRTPPTISQGVVFVGGGNQNLTGNTSLSSSQYDWFGRTYFARLTVNL